MRKLFQLEDIGSPGTTIADKTPRAHSQQTLTDLRVAAWLGTCSVGVRISDQEALAHRSRHHDALCGSNASHRIQARSLAGNPIRDARSLGPE